MSENFMTERLTKDDGEQFRPTRYSLVSENDVIVKPYATYDLFFEIEFKVIQKLGTYEDIGTPEELKKLKDRPKWKWEKDKLLGECAYVCSHCYTIWTSSEIENMHYCPSCGVEMEVEK